MTLHLQTIIITLLLFISNHTESKGLSKNAPVNATYYRQESPSLSNGPSGNRLNYSSSPGVHQNRNIATEQYQVVTKRLRLTVLQ